MFILDWIREVCSSLPDDPEVDILAHQMPSLYKRTFHTICNHVRTVQSLPSTLNLRSADVYFESAKKSIRVFICLKESLNYFGGQNVGFFKAYMCRFTPQGQLRTTAYQVKEIVAIRLSEHNPSSKNRIHLMQHVADKTLFPKNYAFINNTILQEKALSDLYQLYRDLDGLYTLDPETKRLYIINLVFAVAKLEEKGVVHSDLKLENVLVFPNGLKLTDFGHAQLTANITTATKLCGTLHILAPELFRAEFLYQLQAQATHESDVWALGLLLHAFSSPKLSAHEAHLYSYEDLLNDPNASKAKIQQCVEAWEKSLDELPSYPKEIETLPDLIAAMLQRDPNKRIRASEASRIVEKIRV